MSKSNSRANAALVIACVALASSLTGGAIAATLLTGKNIKNSSLTGSDIKNSSITTSDIKNSNLTGSDIKTGSVTSSDIKDGSLLKGDFKAGELQNGAQGPTGPQGPPGSTPSTTLNSGLTLRGRYLARFTAVAGGDQGGTGISFGFSLSAAPTSHFIPQGGPNVPECPGERDVAERASRSPVRIREQRDEQLSHPHQG